MRLASLAATLDMTPRTLSALERACAIRQAEPENYVIAGLDRFNALMPHQIPTYAELEHALKLAVTDAQRALRRTLVLKLRPETLRNTCARASRLRMPVHRYILCATLFELANDSLHFSIRRHADGASESTLCLLPTDDVAAASWQHARAVL